MKREYPSLAFLTSGAMAVADGDGLLYILPIREPNTDDESMSVDGSPNVFSNASTGSKDAEPIGIFTLRTGGPPNTPFRIHHIYRASPITVVLLLSSRYYPPNGPVPGQQVEFDIWAVQISLLSLRPGVQQRELDVLWHRRGTSVPIYATFVQEAGAWLVVGGSSYLDPNVSHRKSHEPTEDEIAPIPRAGELLDVDDPMIIAEPKKPYPYSWYQTSDSVTVAFPLPSSTPKSKIKVIFTMQTLTLRIDSYPLGGMDSTPVSLPHYTTKALWDSIDISGCFWTWDREGDREPKGGNDYGLLTLHMEKRNVGTRWVQIFAAKGPAATTSLASFSNGEADSEDIDVPESVDPSEMLSILESMEKWTASLSRGNGGLGNGLPDHGLGQGVPSLMEGEMDEEADAAVGRKVCVTWVGSEDGADDEIKTMYEPEPISLLSTPLPGSSTSGEDADVSLVLKHDLDGTVFSLTSSSESSSGPNSQFTHTSTYPALSFVLASKQDTRFTFHIPSGPSRGVLAFEGGSVKERGANVYIYRPTASSREKWAKQSVLQVDNGSGGALLGAGCVHVVAESGRKEIVIVCLTEGELVLLRNI